MLSSFCGILTDIPARRGDQRTLIWPMSDKFGVFVGNFSNMHAKRGGEKHDVNSA